MSIVLALVAIAATYLIARYTGVALRGVIAWAAFLAGLIYIAADAIRLNITGLAILGVALLFLWAWLIGVFTNEFWFRTIPEDHPDALGSLDLAERAHRQEQTDGTDIQC